MDKFDLEERLITFSVLIIEIENALRGNNELISIFVKSIEIAQRNLNA